MQENVTQLVDAINEHVANYPDPKLYLTEDDVWDMAIQVLAHTNIQYTDEPNDLVLAALEIVWDSIPGVEIRGTWEECF